MSPDTEAKTSNATVKLRFVGLDKEVEAQVGDNILDVALRNEIDLDHACGGVCACSTCHVKVLKGAECLVESTEEEEDQLDEARDVDLTSRLGCQGKILRVPEGGVLEVKIPEWNVNLVQEGEA